MDRSRLPDGFPAELSGVAQECLSILRRCWEARGGVEPSLRGVGIAIQRNPRADHVEVAHRLEYWLVAGRGARVRCGDVAARFRDWVAKEGKGERTVDPAIARANAWMAGYAEGAA